MNKLLSFTISLATQIWSLFVLMTVWNWFASSWHVFTFKHIAFVQMFVYGLMLPFIDVKENTVKDNARTAVLSAVFFALAGVAKYFQ